MNKWQKIAEDLKNSLEEIMCSVGGEPDRQDENCVKVWRNAEKVLKSFNKEKRMDKTKAFPIENAYDGTLVTAEDGSKWLTIRYDDMTDHRDPWKWPQFMQCQGMVFRWMSWNSDNHNVNYKECSYAEICKPYKKGR